MKRFFAGWGVESSAGNAPAWSNWGSEEDRRCPLVLSNQRLASIGAGHTEVYSLVLTWVLGIADGRRGWVTAHPGRRAADFPPGEGRRRNGLHVVVAASRMAEGLLGRSKAIHVLKRYNPMNAIGAKDAEPAFIVAAEINQAAMALAGTGERHLVNRSNALPIFILEQDNRLAGHRGGQAKIRELDNLAGDGLARSRSWGMRLRVHSLIEAEAMYQLK
jgi:hypothetical protein